MLLRYEARWTWRRKKSFEDFWVCTEWTFLRNISTVGRARPKPSRTRITDIKARRTGLRHSSINRDEIEGQRTLSDVERYLPLDGGEWKRKQTWDVTGTLKKNFALYLDVMKGPWWGRGGDGDVGGSDHQLSLLSLSVCLSFHSSICLYIWFSVRLSYDLSVYLSAIYLSFYLSVYLSLMWFYSMRSCLPTHHPFIILLFWN